MIYIRPILPREVPAARRIILTVGYHIFGFDGSLEDSVRYFENSGAFRDMDDIQKNYFDNGGLFLAVLDDQKLIGTGAVRKLDASTCELKRMWLLEEYHGQGIGYRVFLQIRDFARLRGYRVMRLQTSPQQLRAIAFYQRLGFYPIPRYNDEVGEISMEIQLLGTKTGDRRQ